MSVVGACSECGSGECGDCVSSMGPCGECVSGVGALSECVSGVGACSECGSETCGEYVSDLSV